MRSGMGYCLLLRFYPRSYRRERGREMVDTFLEAGRTRPSLREALNLFGHGMRCRLGRPASRTVVVWAGLTAVLCGLFVASGATRWAWETAGPLPGNGYAGQIFESALPDLALSRNLVRSKSLFVRENWDDLRPVYRFGDVRAQMNGVVNSDRHELARATRQRLLAAGWQVRGPRIDYYGYRCDDPCPVLPNGEMPEGAVPAGGYATLQARRGDDLLEITMDLEMGSEGTNLVISLSRATPWAVRVAGVAGGLLGALLGWLVFGWASRRTQPRPYAQAFARFFYGLTLAFWCLPITWGLGSMVPLHLQDKPLRWHPLWEWLGHPAGRLLFGLGCATALLALAFAASPTRPKAPVLATRDAAAA